MPKGTEWGQSAGNLFLYSSLFMGSPFNQSSEPLSPEKRQERDALHLGSIEDAMRLALPINLQVLQNRDAYRHRVGYKSPSLYDEEA